MREYRKATIQDIIKDARSNDRIDELKAMASRKTKGRKISFLELKRLYFEEFYQDKLPQKKEKTTFWDMIDEL